MTKAELTKMFTFQSSLITKSVKYPSLHVNLFYTTHNCHITYVSHYQQEKPFGKVIEMEVPYQLNIE